MDRVRRQLIVLTEGKPSVPSSCLERHRWLMKTDPVKMFSWFVDRTDEERIDFYINTFHP